MQLLNEVQSGFSATITDATICISDRIYQSCFLCISASLFLDLFF
jgi:hypothetical protein